VKEPPASSPPRIHLVDLATDPLETTDLSDTHPEIRDRLLAAMRTWWYEIREEDHAFAAPTFRLLAGDNTVPARTPSEVAGAVFNMVTSLRGWGQPGDHVRYRLLTEVAAEGVISLRWRGSELPAGAEWVLRIPETGAAARTDGSEAVELALPEGVFHLEIELVEAGNGQIPDLQQIRIRLP
jgi:hypothetical protein